MALRGDLMPSDALALLAVVILAFPMACFFLSSPAFLLIGLEIPEVGQLLRGLIKGYFLAIGILGGVATVLLVLAGRPLFAVGAVILAVFAIAVRRWLLQRVDAAPARQLRLLHVQSMLINMAQLAVVMASVPVIVE